MSQITFKIRRWVVVLIWVVVALLTVGLFKAIKDSQRISTPTSITPTAVEIERQEDKIKEQIENEVNNTIDTPSLDDALHILEW